MCKSYVPFAANRRPFGSLLLFCLFALSGSSLTAQITQDFSTPPAGTNQYVDPISPLTPHILPNTALPQTQPNTATVGTTPGYQVTYQPSRERDVNGGLSDGELFGVVDVTIPASPTNDMGTLGIDFVSNPPPSGNNRVYIMDDPDGLATLRFNPVMITATTMFSMSYIIASTSFENSDGADDRIAIYLENLGDGTRIELLSAANELIPNTEMWVTLARDLSAFAGTTMQLVVEFDTNATAEEMALDNIVFSAGTLTADWPACMEPSIPSLTQSPATVCPLVPFRLSIDGNLGNATEWVIYSDEAATQEVGRTSSSVFDVFDGAIPGTAYFVRGEGGCAENTVFAGLVLEIDGTDCAADAPPGTSFEEPLAATTDYVDTGDPNTQHDLMNNQEQPTVSYAGRGKELGFEMIYLPARAGTGAGIGATDGDAVGVTNDADFNFPDGSQGLVLEDTDGTLGAYLSPVDISGLTGVTVSFDYFINATSYEVSATGTDRVFAVITQNLADREDIFNVSADGSGGFPGLVIGEWTTISYTLTGSYDTPIQLALAADLDAGSERIIFDNVSFSAGTAVCQDTDAPLVSCPDPISVDAGADCMATVDYPAATAFDDCSGMVTIAYSQESGTAFAAGVNTVTVTATDESGKSSMCTFAVTVTDVTPPTLDCPAITVQVDSTTGCTFVVPDAAFDPVTTDNCSVTLLSGTGLSSLAGETILSETTEISWTATDAAGLTATCVQQVTVVVTPSCFPTSVAGHDASAFSAVRAIPNPFTAGTTLSFELPVNVQVDIEVLDLSGRVLTTGLLPPSGNNTYSWYWDAQQQALPAGMYFARLRAAGSVYTQRLVLIK